MKLQVIVGGQAGSEGKGAVAGYLAAEMRDPTCIRVAGPNAGHSVVNPVTGVKHALRQIPVGAVTNPDAMLGIAAGSEIDLGVLYHEARRLRQDGIDISGRLLLDYSATILESYHIDREQGGDLVGRIGSTGKGIGAARADRIMRVARTVRDLPEEELGNLRGHGIGVTNVAPWALGRNRSIQIEGTQGYQLGLHHHYYPQVTSSDCTALDFLQMARINPWAVKSSDLEIWVVFRPYPIRVAGNSGPMYEERTWADLNLPEEQTTVTKKTRRVGLFDPIAAADAVVANGLQGCRDDRPGPYIPIRLALTMVDQLDPELAGATDWWKVASSTPVRQFLYGFERACGALPNMVTTSDRTYASRNAAEAF